MGLATEIMQYLPLLRRHARAVTGDQVTGDDCVALMIERVIRRGRGDGTSAKVALYQDLADCLAVGDHFQSPTAMSDVSVGHLQGLSITSRQALLLTSLEGFTDDEAAQVLRLSESEFRELCDAARRALEKLLFTDVLIIEDEFFISRDLANIVTGLGHRVMARARTHAEARRAVAKARPGLILADVQLADGSSGIEAVTEIIGAVATPVIFITAFPDRLLTGLRPEPTFLIAKPYRVEEVKAVISHCLFFNQKARLGSGTAGPKVDSAPRHASESAKTARAELV